MFTYSCSLLLSSLLFPKHKITPSTTHNTTQHNTTQGADHFYLIDNNSTDEPLRILQPYIDRGLVTYVRRDEKYRQLENYWFMFTEYKMANRVK